MNIVKKSASLLFLMLGLAVLGYLILLLGDFGYRNLGGLIRVGTVPLGIATVLFWSAGNLGSFPHVAKIALLCLVLIVLALCFLSIVASGVGRVFVRPLLLIVTFVNGYTFFDLLKSIRNSETKSKSRA